MDALALRTFRAARCSGSLSAAELNVLWSVLEWDWCERVDSGRCGPITIGLKWISQESHTQPRRVVQYMEKMKRFGMFDSRERNKALGTWTLRVYYAPPEAEEPRPDPQYRMEFGQESALDDEPVPVIDYSSPGAVRPDLRRGYGPENRRDYGPEETGHDVRAQLRRDSQVASPENRRDYGPENRPAAMESPPDGVGADHDGSTPALFEGEGPRGGGPSPASFDSAPSGARHLTRAPSGARHLTRAPSGARHLTRAPEEEVEGSSISAHERAVSSFFPKGKKEENSSSTSSDLEDVSTSTRAARHLARASDGARAIWRAPSIAAHLQNVPPRSLPWETIAESVGRLAHYLKPPGSAHLGNETLDVLLAAIIVAAIVPERNIRVERAAQLAPGARSTRRGYFCSLIWKDLESAEISAKGCGRDDWNDLQFAAGTAIRYYHQHIAPRQPACSGSEAARKRMDQATEAERREGLEATKAARAAMCRRAAKP